ncbi:MAG: hypothetical protein FWC80_00570 [Firmicutes bacterium]|nr:hypothetical protein [Bacillota bacterium]
MPKNGFTTKDLTVLQEVMTFEMLMHKKCTAYASQAIDSSLRQIMSAHADSHKKRFDTLFAYLGQQ